MLILMRDEDEVIDSYRPQTDMTSTLVTQSDNPGTDLQVIGGVAVANLPSPSIGGENGSKIRNGFSNGFRSLASRVQRFNGAMITPPAIRNAVQGEVGTSGMASKLHAGVMNQLVQYTPSQSAYAASYVGTVEPTTVVTAR